MQTYEYMEMVVDYIKRKVVDTDYKNKIVITSNRVLDGNLNFFVEEWDELGDVCFYVKFSCENSEYYFDMMNRALIDYFRNSTCSFIEFVDQEMSLNNLSLVFNNGGLITFIEDVEKEWEKSSTINDACCLVDGCCKRKLYPEKI